MRGDVTTDIDTNTTSVIVIVAVTVTVSVSVSVSVYLLLVRGADGGRDGDRWWTVVGWGRSHGDGQAPLEKKR